MKYYRVKKDGPEAETVADMKDPSQVNKPYPEFVPTFHEWMLPQQQVENANRLNEITKSKKDPQDDFKNEKQ